MPPHSPKFRKISSFFVPSLQFSIRTYFQLKEFRILKINVKFWHNYAEATCLFLTSKTLQSIQKEKVRTKKNNLFLHLQFTFN